MANDKSTGPDKPSAKKVEARHLAATTALGAAMRAGIAMRNKAKVGEGVAIGTGIAMGRGRKRPADQGNSWLTALIVVGLSVGTLALMIAFAR